MESTVRQTVMHARSRASLYFLSLFAAWDRGSRTEPEVTGWQGRLQGAAGSGWCGIAELF